MAKNFLDYAGLAHLVSKIKTALTGKADLKNGVHIVTTGGDGAAYTADVPGITELTAGVNFIMIPHVVSSTTQPTLNVNGLGAKNLRQPLTNNTAATATAALATWLSAGKPVWVKYDGTQWKTDIPRPSASGLYGTVPIDGGGTGATTAQAAAAALLNVGIDSGVTSYPTTAGIYRVIGTDIFSNLKAAHGAYGVLVIFEAAYGLHMYIDNYGRLFWGRSGDSFAEPTTWNGQNVLNSYDYGSTLPTAGAPGRIFYKKVSS